MDYLWSAEAYLLSLTTEVDVDLFLFYWCGSPGAGEEESIDCYLTVPVEDKTAELDLS